MTRDSYRLLALLSLSLSATAAILAAIGGVLGQPLAAASSLLCAGAFGVPGIYFLGYVRRREARGLALSHAARFASSRRVLDPGELASELDVSREDAEGILRTAVREGYVSGTFDDRGRFLRSETTTEAKEDG